MLPGHWTSSRIASRRPLARLGNALNQRLRGAHPMGRVAGGRWAWWPPCSLFLAGGDQRDLLGYIADQRIIRITDLTEQRIDLGG